MTEPIAINYIEFNVADIAKSKAFYTHLGWHFTDFGPQYCEFHSGSIKGGFYQNSEITEINAGGGALVILYSPEIEKSYQMLQAIGAEITMEITPFPGGKRFHFKDPDGYVLAIWSDQ